MPVKTLRFQREEVVDFFREQFKDRAGAVMAEAAVLDLVRQGVISSGKAAELLGIGRWDMPDFLARHDVFTTDYDAAATDEETAALHRFASEGR